MPHGGRSVQELINAGIFDAVTVQHAVMDELLDAQQGDGLLEELFDCMASGQTEAECLGGEDAEEEGAQGGPAESIDETGTRSEDRESDVELTRIENVVSEEVISQVSRQYFDIETPEKFLDDFNNAMAGFAMSMSQAGLSPADMGTMLNPNSGFMRSMWQEFMGRQAQRAAAGEDIYEVVGVEGDQELLGTREGQVTTTDIRRMTRVEAEEELRRTGQEVTSESIQRTIDEDFQSQQAALTTTTEETSTTEEDRLTTVEGSTEFTEEIEIFSQPKLDQVFAFSPTDFFNERFNIGEEMDEDAIGRLATEIRTSAPRQRPGGGSPTSVSARRA